MQQKAFYLTTTLPYVNAVPHIGHALEIVQADVLARYKRKKGFGVFFNFGVDEHGLKIFKKAQEMGLDPQVYCDQMAEHFLELKHSLNVSTTSFIRTTDPAHKAAAQEFWKRCVANGDIYKKHYLAKYCVGCEEEKTDSELTNGRCSIHTNLELETIDEENYFFAFSKYQDKLLKLYKSRPDFIVPSHRLKEIHNFVASGLRDFSISRVKEKMPWGVTVPGDDLQVMYVWFDALVNYISVLGWPDDPVNFEKFWPGLQFAGKDNLRPQSAMWQAMLMSAGLQNSQQIVIHGYVTSEGKKMSKSLGNVVGPVELVEKYGTDATRYYLLREIPTLDDGDFSWDRYKVRYESDLANTLGNLVSRVLTLAEKNNVTTYLTASPVANLDVAALDSLVESYHYNDALEMLWQILRQCNEYIDQEKPWSAECVEPTTVIQRLLVSIAQVADLLDIFLPETATKIQSVIQEGSLKKIEPLFPRAL